MNAHGLLMAELAALPHVVVSTENTLYPVGFAARALYDGPDGPKRSWYYHDSTDPRHPVERLHKSVTAFYASL